MGNLFSTLLFLFIAVGVISRIMNAVKQQTKQRSQDQAPNPVQHMQDRLQDVLRQQAQGQQQAKPAPPPVPRESKKPAMEERYREGGRLNRQTLEGATVEGFKMEGHRVEGYQVEGRKDYYKHPSDAAPHKKERAAIESSMGKEFAGEGCEPHYRLRRKSIKIKKACGRKIVFDKNTVIDGIIMSEVLTRRGGRRNIGVR